MPTIIVLHRWSNSVFSISCERYLKCISWTLHNVFCLQNRPYSYEIADLSKINVMLNNNDVSDYLKISPTGLEVSNWLFYLYYNKIVLLLKFITVEYQLRSSTVMNTEAETLLYRFKFFFQLSSKPNCDRELRFIFIHVHVELTLQW